MDKRSNREGGKGLPKWFCVLFSVLMLVACGILAWSAVEQETLTASLADARLSLETSQGRERKQNSEYAAVSE